MIDKFRKIMQEKLDKQMTEKEFPAGRSSLKTFTNEQKMLIDILVLDTFLKLGVQDD